MDTAATGHTEETHPSKLDQLTECLSGAGRQVCLAGLGILAISGHETSRLFHVLVEKGKEFEPSIKDSFKKVREGVSGKVGGVGKEARHLFDELVEKGKEVQPAVKDSFTKLREKVRWTAGKTEGAFDERILAAMQRLGVPTREDIQTLTRRVEAIASKLGVAEEEGKTATGEAEEKPGGETTS